MSSDNSAKLKNAASLLVKGGTLTGEPCEKCGGVTIKYGDKITCINCGAEKQTTPPAEEVKEPAKPPTSSDSDLGACITVLEQKIVRLTSEIEGENDLLLQKQKADLLESYLRILEKIRELSS
jgi:uncharacterized Zn finger protein (UPF0148 family)